MNYLQKSIPFFTFPSLQNKTELVHFITTREGGVSENPYTSFNLSFKTGDDPDLVEQNRTILAESFGIERSKLIFPTQTHNDKIVMINGEFLEKSDEQQNMLLNEVDALITNITGICLCVLTADCASILLFDPVSKSIGIAHAGWRGTVNQIALKTVEAMKIHFGSNASDLLACIGPCISVNVFEVGEEVAIAFDNAFQEIEGIVVRKPEWNRPHVDIKKANCFLLNRAGIPENQIDISDVCTYSNSETFYSARMNSKGRFAAGIMLKEE